MESATFICNSCGHELPWNYQHEEKPGTCFLDVGAEADQATVLVDRIVAAMRLADETHIHADGYSVRDYVSHSLISALRQLGVVVRLREEEE